MTNSAQKHFDVVSMGEFLIDMVSTRQNVGLFEAPSFEPKPGGAPANLAVGVRRLGPSVSFVGKIGKDEFGQGLRQLLQQEGIDTSNLLDDDTLLTTLALVSHSDKGDPHFAFFVGAHANIKPSELDKELIRNARIFHFCSVMMAHEPSCSATFEALRIAREAHVICSYDVNWRPALWNDKKKGLEIAMRPLHSVDILKMNAAELELITGESDVHRGLEKIDTSAQIVIVTLSEKGCAYRFDGKVHTEQGAPVDHVVDGTGAGDAFMAATLAGVKFPLQVADLPILMRRACRAGAIATTKRGAIPSLPYAADLESVS